MTATTEKKEKVRVFFLRYLPPKTTGQGELFGVSRLGRNVDEFNLKQWREESPELFERPGFYSLLYSDGDNMTIELEKENK